MKTIVSIGEVLWDLFPEGKQLGGAPANFAYHVSLWGTKSLLISRVGNDRLGQDAVERVRGWGLSTDFIQSDPEHPSGTVRVAIDERGIPNYRIGQDVAWDYLEFPEGFKEWAVNADAVCYGTLAQRSEGSRNTIRQFLHYTKPECLRTLDLNLRQDFFSPELIHTSLELANVLKLNDEELKRVGELLGITGSEEEILAKLTLKYSLELIVLTCGPKGSILFKLGKTSISPGMPTKVVDTVGAGDSFTAAVVVGLLDNISLDTINFAANRIAGYVCSQRGATPPVPLELLRWEGES